MDRSAHPFVNQVAGEGFRFTRPGCVRSIANLASMVLRLAFLASRLVGLGTGQACVKAILISTILKRSEASCCNVVRTTKIFTGTWRQDIEYMRWKVQVHRFIDFHLRIIYSLNSALTKTGPIPLPIPPLPPINFRFLFPYYSSHAQQRDLVILAMVGVIAM